MINNILIIILNILFLLIAPFFMVGLIKKTKAFFGGRKGISIFQPFYDFLKLLKKGQVISLSTSWIFKIAPLVIFCAVIFAGLFAPIFFGKAIIELECAFVVFSYLLGFSKFFAIISAFDTASSFEGMGASREACFTTLIEPAFFIILASIATLTDNLTFNSISNILSSTGAFGILITIMSVAALFIMLLVECSRVPVDDPETHLELTMIHEVMILDNSGFDLAIITYASGIKMAILSSLIANLILPNTLPALLFAVLFVALVAIIAIVIGIIESMMARIRMSHVFEFVFIMSSIALVIASLVAVRMFGV